MDEKTKLFVFAKKEIALIFIFMVLVAIISFVLGVKIGKKYSYQAAGLTQADQQRVDLLSTQEEVVEDIVKTSEQHSKEEDSQIIESTDDKLKEEFEKLNKSEDKYINEPEPSKVEDSVGVAETENSVSKDMLNALKKKDELSGKYTIQLGSYRKLEEAEKFADGFRIRGYNPIINETNLKERGVWFRISLGIFNTASEAKDYIIKEKSLFQGTDYVIGHFD